MPNRTEPNHAQPNRTRQYVAEPINSNNTALIMRRSYVSDHNALEGKNCLRKYANHNVIYRVYRIDLHGTHVTVYRGKL